MPTFATKKRDVVNLTPSPRHHYHHGRPPPIVRIDCLRQGRPTVLLLIGSIVLGLLTLSAFRLVALAPTAGSRLFPSTSWMTLYTSNTNHYHPPDSHRYELPDPSLSLYQPAPVEAYIMNHLAELQLDVLPPDTVLTCRIWNDPHASPYHKQLLLLAEELQKYHEKFWTFQLDPSLKKDVRRHLLSSTNNDNDNDNDTAIHHNHQVCAQLELHPHGLLRGLFNASQQLSFVQDRSHRKDGYYMEPLLPPMRHPDLCLPSHGGWKGHPMDRLVSLEYLIHDWAAICRSLQPHSRTVFVDMGASLQFHRQRPSPVLQLLQQYRHMGIVFDHIYAYELNDNIPVDRVYQQVPPEFRAAFHWINLGVSANPKDTTIQNPFQLLLDHFEPHDFIVVKLDIDTPGVDKSLERSLADQLFDNPALHQLIDQFYFEHHVNQEELFRHWGPTRESVQETFRLFHGLRHKGVAAHFWV